jgi:hypothetical protein
MAGTGEVDHELASEAQELEKELEKEKEEEKEKELEKEEEREREMEMARADESGVAPNFKPAHISDELAALGYYARSMKPRKGWLSERESFLIFDKSLSTSYFRSLWP